MSKSERRNFRRQEMARLEAQREAERQRELEKKEWIRVHELCSSTGYKGLYWHYYEDETGSYIFWQTYCSLCGKSIRNGELCDVCAKAYEEDLIRRRYPPALPADFYGYFCFSAWFDLRKIEQEVKGGVLSLQDAQKKMQEVIKRICDTPENIYREEQKKREKEQRYLREAEAEKARKEALKDFKLY